MSPNSTSRFNLRRHLRNTLLNHQQQSQQSQQQQQPPPPPPSSSSANNSQTSTSTTSTNATSHTQRRSNRSNNNNHHNHHNQNNHYHAPRLPEDQPVLLPATERSMDLDEVVPLSSTALRVPPQQRRSASTASTTTTTTASTTTTANNNNSQTNHDNSNYYNSALFMDEPPSLVSLGDASDGGTGGGADAVDANDDDDDHHHQQQQQHDSSLIRPTVMTHDRGEQQSPSAASFSPSRTTSSATTTTTAAAPHLPWYDPRRNSVCSSEETGSTVSDILMEDEDYLTTASGVAAAAIAGGIPTSPTTRRSATPGTKQSTNTSATTTTTTTTTTTDVFYPQPSRDYEWMGRSVESLVLGHWTRAPLLSLPQEEEDDESFYYYYGGDTAFFALRRRSTASTFGGGGGGGGGFYGRRRSSQGSFPGGRRGSLSLSGNANVHGGTLANYYNSSARRSSNSGGGGGGASGGTTNHPLHHRRGPAPNDVDRSYSIGGGGGGNTNSSSNNNNNSNDPHTPNQPRQGRRGSTTMTSHTPMYRRRSSLATTTLGPDNETGTVGPARKGGGGGPNVVLSLLARDTTGKSCFARNVPATTCLRAMGGHALFAALDRPAAGMATEVAFLAAAIDTGDWAETQTIVSRLAPRLVGDPMAAATTAAAGSSSSSASAAAVRDPNLPPTAPRFYAGGGRTGLERDAFVQAGGVDVLIRVFREKSFVGQEMADSYDARDLSSEIVATRLAQCWNEALVSLRELVYSIPSLVEDRKISDHGEFLPFLFTLLTHDACFDAAAALIEEILALLTQSPQPQPSADVEGVAAVVAVSSNSNSGSSQVNSENGGGPGEEGAGTAPATVPAFQPVGRHSPPTTFFLGNVPNLYQLWAGFNCRQLAHFCRILALLIFEPEDRQLLESPAILKSLELLLLRRNRAVRAGRDSTVDMNQSILLGDERLLKRLLQLLRVMNFAPSLRRVTPYHVMAQYPFIGDTLVMLGLNELDQWSEIDRQDELARKLYEEEDGDDAEATERADQPLLGELGNVADMLEGLSETMNEPANQIGHIIRVISAAQQAGVIVGRNTRQRGGRRGRRSRASQAATSTPPAAPSVEDQETAAAALRSGAITADDATIQGLASVAGILTDQVLVRRLYQSPPGEDGDIFGGGYDEDGNFVSRHFINTPEDAANSMQFNGMLLGPYQVEVLFVLCTLMGGRRKLDAQDMLKRLGLVPVLHDMFQRLPWYKKDRRSGEDNRSSDHGSTGESSLSDSQPNGIHGPGCECTPESALCIQYLRLLHNFCDRDCDNYTGRRLLLSDVERRYVFSGGRYPDRSEDRGLLSKIVQAFIEEPDDSPYRFWLASCIESYLRGSSPEEQMFAAQSGLMAHLIDDVSSDRLHCAGSLQTSFDLLGELGKGNPDVIRLLVNDLDEESFRKLMSVAAANLVDSNVFIRSLLLSLERLAAQDRFIPLYAETNSAVHNSRQSVWTSQSGPMSRAYLTHSWWDAPTISLLDSPQIIVDGEEDEESHDDARPADWFPTSEVMEAHGVTSTDVAMLPSGLQESVGHFGWLFTPGGDCLAANTYLPNSVERLSWFLAANQARLLRDLLGVVDLRNINHENICCLNTAVVIAIFAHRRRQLPALLEELRQMNDEEKESKRRALAAARHDDVVDRAFVQAMRYLDLDNQRETPAYARRRSLTSNVPANTASQQIGDRADVMRNFREVLWFWTEYYTHRGRDRLSLEFSSHIRFQEWNHVVALLSADDGSSTALIRSHLRLPRSPYQRAARIADNPVRGV